MPVSCGKVGRDAAVGDDGSRLVGRLERPLHPSVEDALVPRGNLLAEHVSSDRGAIGPLAGVVGSDRPYVRHAVAVDALGHHPSIAVRCVQQRADRCRRHPPEDLPDDDHSKRARAAAAVVEQEHPRPMGEAGVREGRRDAPTTSHSGVMPHVPEFGGSDSHLYFGWYHGDDRDLPGFAASFPRMVRFVSEFGAQAVPSSSRLHRHEQLAAARVG